MDEELKQIRKFVAERLSKFGLKLRETYDDHAKDTDAWSLIIFASERNHEAMFISNVGFQTITCVENVHSQTQDDLWKTALFELLVKSKKAFYVKHIKISIAEDGVIEHIIKTELLFGVDVSDCTSWKEVMLKCAISKG